MTTFPITQAIRRHISRPLAEALPGILIAELSVTNKELTVKRTLTADEVQRVQAMIAGIDTWLAEQRKTRTDTVNTFGWMHGKEAQQWRRMVKPKRGAK